ncbi:MAG: hypothetical protein [Caudoviricetes sp.]|nr:MAG: hypothetical protein [Caudoviricetes sp.]
MSELKVKANVDLVLVAEGKEYPLTYSDENIFDGCPIREGLALRDEVLNISKQFNISFEEAEKVAIGILREFKQKQDDKLLKSVLTAKEEIRQGKGMSSEEVMAKLKESRKQ